MIHWRVGRYPGAEQRCGSGEIEVGGDPQNKSFIHNDAAGVSTIGETSKVFVWGIEGEDHVRAELLKAGFALGAGAVRIDHATDRSDVAGFKLGSGRADPGNAPDDLMAGDNRVIRGHELAPLVADRMEIGVTDAAVKNLYLDILGTGLTPGNTQRRQTRSCVLSSVK